MLFWHAFVRAFVILFEFVLVVEPPVLARLLALASLPLTARPPPLRSVAAAAALLSTFLLRVERNVRYHPFRDLVVLLLFCFRLCLHRPILPDYKISDSRSFQQLFILLLIIFLFPAMHRPHGLKTSRSRIALLLIPPAIFFPAVIVIIIALLFLRFFVVSGG